MSPVILDDPTKEAIRVVVKEEIANDSRHGLRIGKLFHEPAVNFHDSSSVKNADRLPTQECQPKTEQ